MSTAMQLVVLFLSLFRVSTVDCFGFEGPEPYEKQLIDSLFKNYNNIVRPSESPNVSINVSIAMTVESLTDVNDKEGTITVSGWIDMIWQDVYLCWDPKLLGNITRIIVPSEKVWRPDVAFNSAVGERFFNTKDVPIEIKSGCIVAFSPGGRSTHSCDFDMTLFPFDSQRCQFILSTWYSEEKSITLTAVNLTFDHNEQNEIWDIVASDSTLVPENEYSMAKVIFTLHLRRKPLYYVLYVIIPLVMLAVLNLLVFRLPSHAGEKISLSITVLLAFSIWLLMLNDLTPQSSDSIPILGILITLLMIVSAASTIITVHVVRIHQFDEARPKPKWANRLVRVMQCKKLNNNDEVKELPEDHVAAAMSWHAVSEAADKLAFIVFSLLTIFMFIASIISFIALKSQ